MRDGLRATGTRRGTAGRSSGLTNCGVLMTAAAYVLMQQMCLRAARARIQVTWLHDRPLKLGAHVAVSVRRIVLHLLRSTPDRDDWQRIAVALGTRAGLETSTAPYPDRQQGDRVRLGRKSRQRSPVSTRPPVDHHRFTCCHDERRRARPDCSGKRPTVSDLAVISGTSHCRQLVNRRQSPNPRTNHHVIRPTRTNLLCPIVRPVLWSSFSWQPCHPHRYGVPGGVRQMPASHSAATLPSGGRQSDRTLSPYSRPCITSRLRRPISYFPGHRGVPGVQCRVGGWP